jgi:hypothetical protein
VTLRIPCLDPEHHEVDRIELGVAQALGVIAVRFDRGVDSHSLCGRQKLRREAVLHQRLAAAQRESRPS